jgi:hypothetical protein
MLTEHCLSRTLYGQHRETCRFVRRAVPAALLAEWWVRFQHELGHGACNSCEGPRLTNSAIKCSGFDVSSMRAADTADSNTAATKRDERCGAGTAVLVRCL